MNKAVVVPIHKKWLDKIRSGDKTYEFINKNNFTTGMKIAFYETASNKQVVGYATVGEIYDNPYENASILGFSIEGFSGFYDETTYHELCCERLLSMGCKEDTKFAIELKDYTEIEPMDYSDLRLWSGCKDCDRKCYAYRDCNVCVDAKKVKSITRPITVVDVWRDER